MGEHSCEVAVRVLGSGPSGYTGSTAFPISNEYEIESETTWEFRIKKFTRIMDGLDQLPAPLPLFYFGEGKLMYELLSAEGVVIARAIHTTDDQLDLYSPPSRDDDDDSFVEEQVDAYDPRYLHVGDGASSESVHSDSLDYPNEESSDGGKGSDGWGSDVIP
ncbi:uncharacterized protein LOC113318030 [Papaver somniferum]|nr:uncharacterized protein LOC113318030 [Papaver somniferum]